MSLLEYVQMHKLARTCVSARGVGRPHVLAVQRLVVATRSDKSGEVAPTDG